MSRILVYTALTCRRSELAEPSAVQGVDFVCFSDEPELLQSSVWTPKPLVRWLDCPINTSRWHKLSPHIHSPDYDFYVWVNANIGPKRNIVSTVEEQLTTDKIAAFYHRLRTDPMREAERLEANGMEEPDAVHDAIVKLQTANYPKNGGLHETGILLLKNLPEVRRALDYWYGEMRECHGVRDQLHFNRVMRSHGITVKNITPGSVRKNNFTHWLQNPVPVTQETEELRERWAAGCR